MGTDLAAKTLGMSRYAHDNGQAAAGAALGSLLSDCLCVNQCQYLSLGQSSLVLSNVSSQLRYKKSLEVT